MFNFDYKDDLLMMARERERVFSLSRFATQADTENGTNDQVETQANIFSRIYGANEADGGYGARNKNTMVEDSSDAEYAEPARTSYPENAGILNQFGSRPNRSGRSPDDIEMEFN